MKNCCYLFLVVILIRVELTVCVLQPVVITTWNESEATNTAWDVLKQHGSAVDAVVEGCSYCERKQCRMTVGYGGSPDEAGETTLDALVMDGTTMDVGAVGGMREIKEAISVAKHVLQFTEHSLLIGDGATKFAVAMGFNRTNLTTEYSRNKWEAWKKDKCQPNFWKNVNPDPAKYCGPYKPVDRCTGSCGGSIGKSHDTIGMVAMDMNGNVAVGTSTNGLSFKMQGRVGDSPIAGSGGYALSDIGGAAATGNGDVLMRFLPSFHAVQLMRSGLNPSKATEFVAKRIKRFYPKSIGAIIAMNVRGELGAACYGYTNFPFTAINGSYNEVEFFNVSCV